MKCNSYAPKLFLLVFIFVTLVSCQQKTIPEVEVFSKEVKEGSLILSLEEEVLMSYAIDTKLPDDTLPQYYKRSGFIHPLKTLQGIVITDGFPVGHVHQHGLFSAWTNTTFRGQQIDFWNQAKEEAIVKHNSINPSPDKNKFASTIDYIVLIEGDSVIALKENWEMTVIERDDYYVVDWEIGYAGNGADTLHLNKYHYGGPAFRGSGEWNIKSNYDSICYFTTNEGLNHIDANHTRPLWASMYGEIGNATAGIGIIQSKSNLRYPQFIRVHPSMPYFCFTPVVEEPYAIAPNDVLKSKFRLVVFDGAVNGEVMNKEMAVFNANVVSND